MSTTMIKPYGDLVTGYVKGYNEDIIRHGRDRIGSSSLTSQAPIQEMDTLVLSSWHDTSTGVQSLDSLETLMAPTMEAVEYEAEMSWARDLAGEIARYPGEYVALADARIVGHDADFLVLMAGIEKHSTRDPYIVSVPPTAALVV